MMTTMISYTIRDLTNQFVSLYKRLFFMISGVFNIQNSVMKKDSLEDKTSYSLKMSCKFQRSDLPPVTTAEARAAATATSTKELAETVDKLYGKDRDEQNKIWADLQQNHYHPETNKFIELTTRRELEHYIFMGLTLPKIDEFKGRTDAKPHDFSKEGVFFFALPAFYDGGVKGDRIKEMVDSELNRHYKLEAHHPEYEKFSDGKECSELDITEMAIDRLARNAQFGDGWIRLDSLKQYLPKFPLGDNEAKQQIFWSKIEKYQDFVQNEFYSLFPETRAWRKD